MGEEYKLHEGTASNGEYLGNVTPEAKRCALESFNENESVFNNLVPVVIKSDDGKEFAGFKSEGNYQPVTVTHVVYENGISFKMNDPVEVEFNHPSFIENITRTKNPDAGKLKSESAEELAKLGKTVDDILTSSLSATEQTGELQPSDPARLGAQASASTGVDTGKTP